MAQKVLFGITDVTANIAAGSLIIRQNTADFTLIDTGVATDGTLQAGQTVTIKDPNWSGTVTIARQYDIVDIRSGHYKCDITATNTAVAPSQYLDAVPFALSDVPTSSSSTTYNHFTLEDGSGVLLLEDGSAWAPGDYALEGSNTYGYTNLEQSASVNSTGTITYVRCSIFQPGLAAGMQLSIQSANLAPILANPYLFFVILNITTTWPTGVDGPAQFDLELGSTQVTFGNYKQL